MKIEIQPTTQFVDADGVRCRVWEGTLPDGSAVSMIIARVRVDESNDAACQALKAVLSECAPPLVAWPLRMVL